MNAPSDDPTARSAVFAVLLDEALGTWTPNDRGDAVLRAFAAAAPIEVPTDDAGGDRATSSRRPATRAWLAAAVLLGALGAVWAWASSQPPEPTPAPSPAPSQDPERIVRVADLAALRALLPRVRHVEVEALHLDHPRMPFGIDVGGHALRAPEAIAARFRDSLATDATTTQPAGWDWQNRIRLVLDDGRRIEMAVHTYGAATAPARVGASGLRGDLQLRGDGGAAARELVALALQHACRQRGIARSPADLNGPHAFAPTTTSLRWFGMADGFEHLARFPGLRALDVSGLTLDAEALRSIAALTTLQTLALDGVRLGDDGAAVLATTKSPLRELSVRDTPLSIVGIRSLANVLTLRKIDIRGVRGLPLDELAVVVFMHPDLVWMR